MSLTLEEFANNIVKHPNVKRCSYIFIKGADKDKVCNCRVYGDGEFCTKCRSKKQHICNIDKLKSVIETAQQKVIETTQKIEKSITITTPFTWNNKILCNINYIEKNTSDKINTIINLIDKNDNLYIVNANSDFISKNYILTVDIAIHNIPNGYYFLGSIIKISLENPINYNILRFFEDSRRYIIDHITKENEPIFKKIDNNSLFRIAEPYYLQINNFSYSNVKRLNEHILAPAPDIDDCKNPCLFCLSKPRIYAFVPCGHLSACEDCGNITNLEKLNKKECPSCRKYISSIMRIYN